MSSKAEITNPSPSCEPSFVIGPAFSLADPKQLSTSSSQLNSDDVSQHAHWITIKTGSGSDGKPLSDSGPVWAAETAQEPQICIGSVFSLAEEFIELMNQDDADTYQKHKPNQTEVNQNDQNTIINENPKSLSSIFSGTFEEASVTPVNDSSLVLSKYPTITKALINTGHSELLINNTKVDSTGTLLESSTSQLVTHLPPKSCSGNASASTVLNSSASLLASKMTAHVDSSAWQSIQFLNLLYQQNNAPCELDTRNTDDSISQVNCLHYQPSQDQDRIFSFALKTDTNLPALQQANTNPPVLQQVNKNLPALQQVNTSSPALQQVNTSSPALRQVNASSPVLQQVNTSSPALQQVNTSSPALRQVNASTPALQQVNASSRALQQVKTKKEPYIVDVDSEDIDDCILTKIDLSKHKFFYGSKIHNTNVVIDDSDDGDDLTILPGTDENSVDKKGDERIPQSNVISASIVNEDDICVPLNMEVEEITDEAEPLLPTNLDDSASCSPLNVEVEKNSTEVEFLSLTNNDNSLSRLQLNIDVDEINNTAGPLAPINNNDLTSCTPLPIKLKESNKEVEPLPPTNIADTASCDSHDIDVVSNNSDVGKVSTKTSLHLIVNNKQVGLLAPALQKPEQDKNSFSLQMADVTQTPSTCFNIPPKPLGKHFSPVQLKLLLPKEALPKYVPLNLNLYNTPVLQQANINPPALQQVDINPQALQKVNPNIPAVQQVNLNPPALQQVSLNPPVVQQANINPQALQKVNPYSSAIQQVNSNPPVLQQANNIQSNHLNIPSFTSCCSTTPGEPTLLADNQNKALVHHDQRCNNKTTHACQSLSICNPESKDTVKSQNLLMYKDMFTRNSTGSEINTLNLVKPSTNVKWYKIPNQVSSVYREILPKDAKTNDKTLDIGTGNTAVINRNTGDSVLDTKMESKTKRPTCIICYVSFPSRKDLVTHVWNSHRQSVTNEIPNYSCDKCEKVFNNYSLLKLHKKIQCVYMNKKGLQQTINNSDNSSVHMPPASYIQSKCIAGNTSFKSTERNLGKHISMMNTIPNLPSADKLCGQLNENHNVCNKQVSFVKLEEDLINVIDSPNQNLINVMGPLIQESIKTRSEIYQNNTTGSPVLHSEDFGNNAEQNTHGCYEGGPLIVHEQEDIKPSIELNLMPDHVTQELRSEHTGCHSAVESTQESGICQKTISPHPLQNQNDSKACQVLNCKNFKCTVCEKSFSDNTQRYRHMWNSSYCDKGLSTFCSKCSCVFRKPSDKQAHISLSKTCWLYEIQCLKDAANSSLENSMNCDVRKKKIGSQAKPINFINTRKSLNTLKFPSTFRPTHSQMLSHTSEPLSTLEFINASTPLNATEFINSSGLPNTPECTNRSRPLCSSEFTNTSGPLNTPVFTNTPMPLNTPKLTNTPMTLNAPKFTNTLMQLNAPEFTSTPVPLNSPKLKNTSMPINTPEHDTSKTSEISLVTQNEILCPTSPFLSDKVQYGECSSKFPTNVSPEVHNPSNTDFKSHNDKLSYKEELDTSKTLPKSFPSEGVSYISCTVCKRQFETKALLILHFYDSNVCRQKVMQPSKVAKRNVVARKGTHKSGGRKILFKAALKRIPDTSKAKDDSPTQADIGRMKCRTSCAREICSKNLRIILSPVTVMCEKCHLPFTDDCKLAEHVQTSQTCLKKFGKKPNKQYSFDESLTDDGTAKRGVKRVHDFKQSYIDGGIAKRSVKCIRDLNDSFIYDGPAKQGVKRVHDLKESFIGDGTKKTKRRSCEIATGISDATSTVLMSTKNLCITLTNLQQEGNTKITKKENVKNMITPPPGSNENTINIFSAQDCFNDKVNKEESKCEMMDLSSLDDNNDTVPNSSENVVGYNCTDCNGTFISKSVLIDHEISNHQSSHSKKFHCQVCTRKFKDFTELQAHLLKFRFCFTPLTKKFWERKQDPQVCCMCKKILDCPEKLHKHCFVNMTCRLRFVNALLENVAGGKNSEECALSFKKVPVQVPVALSSEMRSHLCLESSPDAANQSTSHADLCSSKCIAEVCDSQTSPSKCQNCDKTYVDLVEHFTKQEACLEFYRIRSKGLPVFPFCFQCKLQFENTALLANHVCRSIIDHKYLCTVCGLKFLHENDLNVHSCKSVSCGKAMVCPVKTLASTEFHQDQNKAHVKEKCEGHILSSVAKAVKITSEDIVPPQQFFSCLICDAKFPSLRLLMEHSHNHIEEIPLKCERCNITFLHYNQYVSHQAFHIRMDKEALILSEKKSAVVQNSKSSLGLKYETGHAAKEKHHKISYDLSVCLFCHQNFSSEKAKLYHISNTDSCKGIMKFIVGNKFFLKDPEDNKYDDVGNTPVSNTCEFCGDSFSDVLHYLHSSCFRKLEEAILRYRESTGSAEFSESGKSIYENSHKKASCKKFRCTNCNKVFENKSFLLDHQKECKQCTDRKSLTLEDGPDDLYCFKCKEYFKTLLEIKHHQTKFNHKFFLPRSAVMQADWDLQNMKCKICDSEYAFQGYLIQHMLKEHCELSNDLLQVTRERKFVCTLCKCRVLESQLQEHFDQHKEDFLAELKTKSTLCASSTEYCIFCKNIYSSKRVLMVHVKRHSLSKMFIPCISSKRKLSEKESVLDTCHEVVETNKLDTVLENTCSTHVTAVTCKICFKNFSKLQFFKLHFARKHLHHDRERYHDFFSPVKGLGSEKNEGVHKYLSSYSSGLVNPENTKHFLDNSNARPEKSFSKHSSISTETKNLLLTPEKFTEIGSCKICHKQFKSFLTFIFHLQNSHELYDVSKWNRYFLKSEDCKSTHSASFEDVYCFKCNLYLSNLSEVENHKFFCKNNNLLTRTAVEQANWNKDNLCCKICESTYVLRGRLANHMMKEHCNTDNVLLEASSQKTLWCFLCNEYIFESKLQSHFKNHKEKFLNTLKDRSDMTTNEVCIFCNSVFNRQNICMHVQNHSFWDLFFCNESSSTGSSLEIPSNPAVKILNLESNHYTVASSADNRENFLRVCLICHCNFEDIPSYQVHLRTHIKQCSVTLNKNVGYLLQPSDYIPQMDVNDSIVKIQIDEDDIFVPKDSDNAFY